MRLRRADKDRSEERLYSMEGKEPNHPISYIGEIVKQKRGHVGRMM